MLRGLPFKNEEGWWLGHSGRSSMLTPPSLEPPAPGLPIAPPDAWVQTRVESLLPGNLLHAYAQMSIMNA